VDIVDFDGLKLRVPRNTISWPGGAFRRASINSFGYGGSNAHVIIDNDLKRHTQKFLHGHHRHKSSITSDWEVLFAEDKATQPYTLVFSANDAKSLKSYCKAISEHLSNPSVAVKLPDLAYTLSERRSRHFHRAYVVTDNNNINEGAFTFGKKNTDVPKIGFVFTGQGAQWSQMGKGIIETFPVAKSLIYRLDHVLQALPKPPSWSLLSKFLEVRGNKILILLQVS
jgi:acyl transferase domain-containing protein